MKAPRRLVATCILVSVTSLVGVAAAQGQGLGVAGTVGAVGVVDALGAMAVTDAVGQLRQAQLRALPLALSGLTTIELTEQSFVTPLPGHIRLSSGFGWRNISVNGNRFHGGIDLPADTGTTVRAARDGLVVRAGWWGTYGYAVAIDHGDGSETRYAHLSSYSVKAGDVLRQGDMVGAVGSTGASTGPHLHFELRFDDRAVDPTAYLEGAVSR